MGRENLEIYFYFYTNVFDGTDFGSYITNIHFIL